MTTLLRMKYYLFNPRGLYYVHATVVLRENTKGGCECSVMYKKKEASLLFISLQGRVSPVGIKYLEWLANGNN